MTWRLARALDTLREQINEKWPNRSKLSDGTIGDPAHAGRKSDHNPNKAGVVQALDITHDPQKGLDARKLAEALVASRDQRIKYVISNGEICSGPGASHPAWKWRPYSGANAHRKHVHISVRDDPTLYDSTAEWEFGAPAIGSTLWIQQSLNRLGAVPKLKEDGNEGPTTQAVIRAFAVVAIQSKLKP